MSRIKFLLIVCLFLCAIGEAVAAEVHHINVAEGQRMLQQAGEKPVLLDVRTPQEFFEARIDGAKLLPTNLPTKTFYERLAALPKDQTYLVYCTVGSRSSQVASIMSRSGFEKVYNLDGGIAEWYKRGYPILQGAP
jgi:rhodanese-related sulfurtransferase